jgi:ribosomal protein S18 acetylase RimI-like enzyme
MGVDPFAGYGLRPVLLTDRAVLEAYFTSLAEPLSDYTFSQLYTWSRSLKIAWRVLEGHLCVFANGTGDLTLLLPPLGDTGGDRALRAAFEVMDDYNGRQGVPDESRVEYVSDECLARFDRAGMRVEPLAADYVYDVRQMIDLPGGDLASKRQAKNRFLRLYEHRVEAYDAGRHIEECRLLLSSWTAQQEARHAEECDTAAIKRRKEADSVEAYLQSADAMGVAGLVVYTRGDAVANQPTPVVDDPRWRLNAFTFGERLGRDQNSIVVEKTNLATKGLAQFVFSEFCRRNWSDRPLVNVGDDWGLESLAWTKNSYRPVKRLQKYTLRRQAAVRVGAGIEVGRTAPVVPVQETVDTGVKPLRLAPVPVDNVTIRPAREADIAGTVSLESACFDNDLRLSRRQLTYLQGRGSAVFLVADRAGEVVGQGIALVRQHKSRGTTALLPSGRVYSLAVRNDCRGQQIGRRLLTAMLERLAARGVRRVYLEVDLHNARAINLYQQQGFRQIGTLPHYYGPDRTAVHMMCELDVHAAAPAA